MKQYLLWLLLVVAIALRVYGMDWDQGFHLHPDERQLIMVANQVHFFDQLNPNFFNYGSLPIYLLKGTSQLIDLIFNSNVATYDGMLQVGRVLSVLFDIGTMLVLYKIGELLFKQRDVGVWAALLYGISFFPIQNAHFFVVDVFLTFFVTSLLYWLLRYIQRPSLRTVVWCALFFGAALATKFSAVLFLPVSVLTIAAGPLLLSRKKLLHNLHPMALYVLSFLLLAVGFYFIFMPYAYITMSAFLKDTMMQTTMSKDAYIFPYTLQYVYTTPYIYFLKNIFLWGLGPVISLLSLSGVVLLGKRVVEDIFSKKSTVRKIVVRSMNYAKDNALFVVTALFYILYFIVIGHSAVKFMRYMLPLYPFLVLIAGYALTKLFSVSRMFVIIIVVAAGIWTLSFVHIYSVEHTRIAATKWIVQHIPQGSSIAVEHWDDRLPITNSENYSIQELTLYDLPDDTFKWSRVNAVLATSQYIIIASNRLYVPLQKLTDCTKYLKCYPETARYYQRLFDGTLGFQKVAEFSDDPKVPLLPISISDQSADESFTVYDHPKIMIFEHHLTGVQ